MTSIGRGIASLGDPSFNKTIALRHWLQLIETGKVDVHTVINKCNLEGDGLDEAINAAYKRTCGGLPSGV